MLAQMLADDDVLIDVLDRRRDCADRVLQPGVGPGILTRRTQPAQVDPQRLPGNTPVR